MFFMVCNCRNGRSSYLGLMVWPGGEPQSQGLLIVDAEVPQAYPAGTPSPYELMRDPTALIIVPSGLEKVIDNLRVVDAAAGLVAVLSHPLVRDEFKKRKQSFR